MTYVTGGNQQGCIFCEKPAEARDEENAILCRCQHNYVILNAFPYNSGHLMVVPYVHLARVTDLPADVANEMFALARLSVAALEEAFRAEAANLGMNVGQAAGAGIRDHLHLHVVPRWSGDTNFMMPMADTRVVPQSLQETWRHLAPVLGEIVEQRLPDLLATPEKR